MPPESVSPKKIPFDKYVPFRPLPLALPDRRWPNVQIEQAPGGAQSTCATPTRRSSTRWTRRAS